MADLTGKAAVVTGASKGIGASIAKALASAGATVVVNYASSEEAAARVVEEIKEKGGQALAVQGDVSKAADVSRLFAETKAAFGAIDILVNNAGVARMSPLETVTEDLYRRLFDTNVLGPILTTREALPHFSANGGSVINIGSVVSAARCRVQLSTPLPRAPLRRSPARLPLNSAAGVSASIRSRPVRSRPTPRAQTASSEASSGRRSSPAPRLAGLAGRKTWPRLLSSWPRTTRAG